MLSSLGAMGLGALVVVFGLVVGAAAAPCNPTATLEYVAMGDSYSSGVGLPDATGECNRSTGYNYPNRIQQDQGFGSFTDVSCSGAKTEHFSTAKNDSSPPQFDALSDTTDVVTFTIGGNDLGFTSILAICALMDDCRDAYGGPGMPKLTAKIAGSVGDSIQQAMEDSAAHAPNADIFVLGYPDLLPATPTGSTWEQSCEPTSLFISDAERNDLRQVQAALNAEIELRVDAAGARVHYVDTYTPSIGHDVLKRPVGVRLHPVPPHRHRHDRHGWAGLRGDRCRADRAVRSGCGHHLDHDDGAAEYDPAARHRAARHSRHRSRGAEGDNDAQPPRPGLGAGADTAPVAGATEDVHPANGDRSGRCTADRHADSSSCSHRGCRAGRGGQHPGRSRSVVPGRRAGRLGSVDAWPVRPVGAGEHRCRTSWISDRWSGAVRRRRGAGCAQSASTRPIRWAW